MNISPEEYKRMITKKPNKYRNNKVEIKNEIYDSEGEYQRWCVLQDYEKSNGISNLYRQVTINICHGVSIKFDFMYLDRGEIVFEDWKPPYEERKKRAPWRHFLTKVRMLKEKKPDQTVLVSSTDGIEEI